MMAMSSAPATTAAAAKMLGLLTQRADVSPRKVNCRLPV